MRGLLPRDAQRVATTATLILLVGGAGVILRILTVKDGVQVAAGRWQVAGSGPDDLCLDIKKGGLAMAASRTKWLAKETITKGRH